MTSEKRRFSRIVISMEAELAVPGKLFKVDEIVNLSVGGCQLNISDAIVTGTECSLLIILNPADRRMNVEVMGKVVRSDEEGIGIQFTSIEPEALVHLQNIIRYNAKDPDRIDSEIDEHPGLV